MHKFEIKICQFFPKNTVDDIRFFKNHKQKIIVNIEKYIRIIITEYE